ncbi:MAG: AmmeMemoRadiSam system protein A [bacterium]|nr:AmmeMemoRadiSam system protein A [bacterium]MDT8396328.1 AmmeMemoRadiSam system protein A [bacterium]
MTVSSSSHPPSHPIVRLARLAIENHLTGEPAPTAEADLFSTEPSGAFVSLKKGGQLRGCIGTILPVTGTLGDEVARNAVSAATRDPRFAPVAPEELDQITVSVDVLTAPQPVSSPDDLDPSRYGVIVQSGYRKGVLLPDLPGIDTVEKQLAIARQKAGIGPTEKCELLRFEVKRYF